MAEVVVGLESALTLQRKSTQHTLVEILPIPYTDVVNCSIPEVKDTNHSKEYEFTAGGIINVSYNWQQKRQTTVMMTLGKRITGLLSVTARALSVKSNKLKATNRKSFLPVHLSVRRESWDHENVLHSSKLKSFTFNELSVATRKFNLDSVVGEGGFGTVYKGWIDENTFAATEWGTGRGIAVKRLQKEYAQGHREWLTEINTLGNLCHPYVVRLIGYCSEKNHRLLVYDFMPQGSLDKHLFNYKGGPPLDWPIRCNIIKNIAKGVRYLHQGSKLIHRDLKASNILFDSEMNPRISDFGLARLTGKSKTELNTSRIVGTHGYMSPEYAMHGRFSVKSDVYSFGVLMLEIVTGTKNYALSNPHFNLSSHAWRLFQEEKCLLLLDKAIRGSCNESELFRAVQVGLLCVQEIPEDRPSMSMVVLMLSSDIKLPKPKQPGFSSQELDSFSGKEIDPYESETPHISFSTTSLFIPR